MKKKNLIYNVPDEVADPPPPPPPNPPDET